jgi:hypothetical protein
MVHPWDYNQVILEKVSMRRSKSPSEESRQRDTRIDLFKAFAILAIMLWHFKLIPTWAFIWAIPVFVFATASLYNLRLTSLTVGKVFNNILWVTGLVGLTTALAAILDLPQAFTDGGTFTILNSLNYLFIRNPYLGHLWYFILYFQLLVVLYILSKLELNNLTSGYSGLLSLVISLGFSYGLLTFIGQGISINIISWAFVIWLGVFHYEKINSFIKSRSFRDLSLYIILGLVLIASILIWGDGLLLSFLEVHTHDFIFPTIFLQASYLVILFSVTELITRYCSQKLIQVASWLGIYSMHLYIFHNYLFRVIFFPRFGRLGIFFVIAGALILGVILERLRLKVRTMFF